MTRVAILGWGSLLWKPETLHNQGKWRSDGPWLPIEFARTSNQDEKKAGNPTFRLSFGRTRDWSAHIGICRV